MVYQYGTEKLQNGSSFIDYANKVLYFGTGLLYLSLRAKAENSIRIESLIARNTLHQDYVKRSVLSKSLISCCFTYSTKPQRVKKCS